MKLIPHKYCFLMLMALILALTVMPLSAAVYKIVDKDGNVTYTDEPPGDGSKPIELKPISVVERPTYETPPKADVDDGEEAQMSLRDMRRAYRDFAIVAPQSEESIWHPEAPITVAWNTGKQLQDGMTVSVAIDGQQQADTTQKIVPVSGLDRGEHTVTAELRNASNQTVASAEPVTFFIRRPNIHTNRARPGPG